MRLKQRSSLKDLEVDNLVWLQMKVSILKPMTLEYILNMTHRLHLIAQNLMLLILFSLKFLQNPVISTILIPHFSKVPVPKTLWKVDSLLRKTLTKVSSALPIDDPCKQLTTVQKEQLLRLEQPQVNKDKNLFRRRQQEAPLLMGDTKLKKVILQVDTRI